jgi:hypothetical protein
MFACARTERRFSNKGIFHAPGLAIDADEHKGNFPFDFVRPSAFAMLESPMPSMATLMGVR